MGGCEVERGKDAKKNEDCTTVATQPRQLHYSDNFSKKKKKRNGKIKKKKNTTMCPTLFFSTASDVLWEWKTVLSLPRQPSWH